MINVKKIVEVINKEGRQGPKDLKSLEVYNWVNRILHIDYQEYMSILKSNSINDLDRNENRNAYFVIDSDGKYKLFKSKEEEIRKYICYIIRENPNITSSEAIKKFKLIYQGYTIVDLMDQKNLSSQQDVIDQTIRNIMVSNYNKKRNNELFYRSINTPYSFTLKQKGYELASEVSDYLSLSKDNELFDDNNDDSLDNIEINKGISIYSQKELDIITKKNKNFKFYDVYDTEKHRRGRIPTDPKIKATRFSQTNYHCECDENHITFPTSSYPNFLEGHHLVPVSLQKNFAEINLDCIQNMVSLCPICHSQIHYGTREAKKAVFDKIVEKRKDDLLSIGFTEEILKVIFDTYY